MFPQNSQIGARPESKTYPLGEKSEHSSDGLAMSLVALSHTPVEHRLYRAMFTAISEKGTQSQKFTARRLMTLTEIRSLSTIRRGLEGLVVKLSIEREASSNGNGGREPGTAYSVYTPEEIIARRNERGIKSYAKGIEGREGNHPFARAIDRVVENRNLSRREAQVALCCVEGLTNAEIGNRLQVTEQTVKFHLRHVFIKFGVKRRAELISRLLL
jgi:DNA-binding CsgD family transcriptional regulator